MSDESPIPHAPDHMHQIVSARHCIGRVLGGGRREAYISAQHTQTCQEARVPLAHEHPRRACRAQEPPRQGPRPTLGLIDRVRERHAFARLGREGTRIRRSALWCSWCPDPASTTTSVAFAITSRRTAPPSTGIGFVVDCARSWANCDRSEPLPPILILIGVRPKAIELTFDQLRDELTALIREIRSQQAPEAPTVAGCPRPRPTPDAASDRVVPTWRRRPPVPVSVLPVVLRVRPRGDRGSRRRSRPVADDRRLVRCRPFGPSGFDPVPLPSVASRPVLSHEEFRP